MKVKRTSDSLQSTWLIESFEILQGGLKETQYAMPATPEVSPESNGPLHKIQETIYHENEVTYISDKVKPASDPVLQTLTLEDWLTQDIQCFR